jgi:hypothetical protein
VQVGQLVLVRLLSVTTTEGYSVQDGHEQSYFPKTDLNSAEWQCRARPALILEVGWDNYARLHYFIAVAISRRWKGHAAALVPKFPILGPSSARCSFSEDMISVHPRWPLDDAYCYAYRRPAKFYCLPSQVRMIHLFKTKLLILLA